MDDHIARLILQQLRNSTDDERTSANSTDARAAICTDDYHTISELHRLAVENARRVIEWRKNPDDCMDDDKNQYFLAQCKLDLWRLMNAKYSYDVHGLKKRNVTQLVDPVMNTWRKLRDRQHCTIEFIVGEFQFEH